MAYKTMSAQYYVKKEEVFGQSGTFTTYDRVEVTTDTAFKPEIASIERKIVDCTFLNKPALAGKETGSGTLGFELIPQGNGSTDLVGNDALEVCLGVREDAGNGTGGVIRSSAEHQVEYTVTADSNNSGDGTLNWTGYNEDKVKTETWTITCTDASNAGAEIWSVEGSESGSQPSATTGEEYDNNIIKFIIKSGDKSFDTGDKFTIDVTSNVACMIYEVVENETGDAVLYKLGSPCGSQSSLAVMAVYGCDSTDNKALILQGIVPESCEIKIPTADIATLSFSLQGTSFKTAENTDIPRCETSDYAIPYVGKNAVFTIDSVEKEAKDVSITISNTIADIESIVTAGVAGKTVTRKEIKGTFTVTFTDWGELNKFKNNGFGKLFIELKTEDTDGNEHKFAIWLPKISYTSVSVEDDNGILVNKIEFQGFVEPSLGEAIYIAHK